MANFNVYHKWFVCKRQTIFYAQWIKIMACSVVDFDLDIDLDVRNLRPSGFLKVFKAFKSF